MDELANLRLDTHEFGWYKWRLGMQSQAAFEIEQPFVCSNAPIA
jgi:hypothetical protein